eukprot:jgi/Galph1/5374/GphlegSOOS_G4001.1
MLGFLPNGVLCTLSKNFSSSRSCSLYTQHVVHIQDNYKGLDPRDYAPLSSLKACTRDKSNSSSAFNSQSFGSNAKFEKNGKQHSNLPGSSLGGGGNIGNNSNNRHAGEESEEPHDSAPTQVPGYSSSQGNNQADNKIPPNLQGVLRAYDVSFESLPKDIKAAIELGVISRSSLSYFLLQLKNPLIGWLLAACRPFRNRVLADSDFLYKILVQELVGNGTALFGEIMVRKQDIFNEVEYVLSDIIVGIVVEATFVWLLAPATPFPSLHHSGSSGNPIFKMLSKLPANMFEASSSTRKYSLYQRALSFLWAGIQYCVIGIGAGVVGTGLTYGMIEVRKRIQPSYRIRRKLPPVVANSLGWGAYMFLSANPRFQALEGLERLCAIMFANRLNWLLKLSIFMLRFGNNLYGGVQFVQFFRALGLQSTDSIS